MPKLLRVVTVDMSLRWMLAGQLMYLNENGLEVVGVAANTGLMDQVRKTEGIRCIDLPMRREIAPVQDLQSLWGMIKLFRRERPEIVHANTPKGSLLAMMAAWFCRVPVRVYTVTGLRFETATGMLRTILKTMERVTCRCATAVVPEGDDVKSMLIREGICKRPLDKIHNGNINGLDLEHYSLVPMPAADVPITFVFIGRVTHDKGIDELVEVFDEICQERHAGNIRLLLVGPLEQELDPISPKTLEIIKRNANIESVGFQNDIRPWVEQSHVVVLPSHREGFSSVPMQAGAMGRPCIMTRVNGAAEVIEDGQSGVLIDIRDKSALKAAMLRLAEDANLRVSMGHRGRKLMEERFDRRDLWEAIRQFYSDQLHTIR